MFKKSAVLILHFAPSRRFFLSCPVQALNFTCAEPNSWRREILSFLLKIGK